MFSLMAEGRVYSSPTVFIETVFSVGLFPSDASMGSPMSHLLTPTPYLKMCLNRATEKE